MQVILVGGGEVVYFLAKNYFSRGDRVSIINKDHMECERFARTLDQALVICGDGTDPKYLMDASAEEAQMLLAVTSKDYINLVCCQTASLMFSVPHTLALINDPDNYEIFRKLGISQVFNLTDLIVSILERNVSYENLNPLFSWNQDKAFVDELRVTERMPSVGRALDEMKLPEKSQVISLERNEKILFPREDTVIQVADRLVLLTTPENRAPTLRILAGEEV